MKSSFAKPYLSLLWMLILVVFLAGKLFAQGNLQTPQIDSITVTSQGFPMITWFPNTDNTQGYVIVKKHGLTWQIVDTVMGIHQTRYVDFSGEPCIRPEWYRIFAFFSDPGNNQQANSPWSDTLRTILLTPPVLDVCANTISLSWSDYLNMIGGLEGYEVQYSTDGTTFQLLAITPPEQTYYLHVDPLPDMLYSYRIVAFNTGRNRTSSSCVQTLQSKTYPKPSFIRIIAASVENNSFVRIHWDADTTVPILQYEIRRFTDYLTSPEILGFITDNQYFKPTSSYEDLSAEFSNRSYYYQIIVHDSCGHWQIPQYLSPVHRTIHLSGQPAGNYHLQLTWNHYEGWQNGIDRYEIFRSIDGQQFSLLAQIPATQNNYTDDISAYTQISGSITYLVTAMENQGYNATSTSNHLTINLHTRLQVPNAFIPDALPPDNEFKPMITFYQPGSYQLQIFNKWGEIIFESKDIQQGWNGKKNGVILPAGAYVYVIRYITPEGQPQEKRGTVTLIR